MLKYITKKEAEKIFRTEMMPDLKKVYPCDKVAYRTAWNDFTDYLCKDGQISEKQYDNWKFPSFLK